MTFPLRAILSRSVEKAGELDTLECGHILTVKRTDKRTTDQIRRARQKQKPLKRRCLHCGGYDPEG